MTWSPDLYKKFEQERTRPARDLLSAIQTDGIRTAADLGCGPGNSTEQLLLRFPKAAVLGIDSSPAMIEAAQRRLPTIDFACADIATWGHQGPFDLILSNAALQWVPGHAALLPALMAKLAPGGCLAVQMPDNLEEPAHRLMREVAAGGPWADKLAGSATARVPRLGAEWYFQTLRGCASSIDLWRTTYYHPLAGGPRAIVDWFESTGLRPFLDPLDASERKAFLQRYEARLADAYPVTPDGAVLLLTPRLFFIAER